MMEIGGPGLGDAEVLPAFGVGARRVVTFYSFKGGVGRTMALANVAFRLANRHALRVLVVDWDLEAPGLHRFLGFEDADLADKPGVVDFFLEWRDRYEKGDDAAPEVQPWILATRAPVPAYGSLSILPAGKQDKDYGGRLSSLDWRAFYSESEGALAVETLRRQLIEAADIVLLDSRTGLTDAGGICTVQLPDGVVLMTAPNEQSLAGNERVARTIASPNAKRAGRERPSVWLSVSRIPLLEETESSHKWLEGHRWWFEQGVQAGLWKGEDHLRGLRSYALPHRARFALGEQILHDPSGPDRDDPLGQAYDKFATLLLEWSHGPRVRQPVEGRQSTDRLEPLQKRVDEATAREDPSSLAIALHDLGVELDNEGRDLEAVAHLERARGILIARGTPEIVDVTLSLAQTLRAQSRSVQAMKLYEETQRLIERFGDNTARGWTLLGMAHVHLDERRSQEAWLLLSRSIEIFRAEHEAIGEIDALDSMAHLRLRQRRLEEAWLLYEGALTADRRLSSSRSEARLLRMLSVVRREQGRLPEAERLCQEALRISASTHDTARVLTTMAMLRHRQRRSKEAFSLAEQAVSILRGIPDPDGVTLSLTDLAAILVDQDLSLANSLLEEASSRLIGSGHPNEAIKVRFLHARILRVRASVHRREGRCSEAVRCGRQALETLRGLREERYEEALTLAELSRAHGANNDLVEAAAARAEGLAILNELKENFDEVELFGPTPAI